MREKRTLEKERKVTESEKQRKKDYERERKAKQRRMKKMQNKAEDLEQADMKSQEDATVSEDMEQYMKSSQCGSISDEDCFYDMLINKKDWYKYRYMKEMKKLERCNYQKEVHIKGRIMAEAEAVKARNSYMFDAEYLA